MEQNIPSEANSYLPSHEKCPEFYRARSTLPCSQETVTHYHPVPDDTDHTFQFIILCQIIETIPSNPSSLRYFNIFILYALKSKRSPSSNCTTKSCVHSVPKYTCYIPGHPHCLDLIRLFSFQI